ncbi:anthranilate phosphoribosyltransferase [Methylococcus geothermalis]|uniref:Anthranilate phosphoribosyltransferase n=1 Tax=Methylococcus geothermalis TaxID=2681310 RepID=A0A858Q6Q7_9GAMM|nr:anthranilate phosphoribosyltransferase [Methylococcus geothermalis]QJD29396.1 anthranilate phosphoribosyltransferase [Methylococcus geothermalis]
MEIPEILETLLAGKDLSPSAMRAAMRRIMSGGATPAQIGAFLIALRCKGETVDEVAAAAQVLREMATKVPVSGPHLLDTCGTGGDTSKTFNISTTAAFVVAAAGGRVAKHGSRSVSGRSGSADVLEAAGVNLELTPDQVKTCIETLGVGFLFAQRHHGAMKYAIGPRRELGVRTLFNLLGPLTNPAGAPNQLVGVYTDQWVEGLARVLQQLGSSHVLVVHAEDGLDEISIAAPTHVAELKNGLITNYEVQPEQFGFERAALSELAIDTVAASLKMMHGVLDNVPGPARDIVALNAGAAIYAADLTDSLEAGVRRAEAVIADGSARAKLEALAALSRQFAAS